MPKKQKGKSTLTKEELMEFYMSYYMDHPHDPDLSGLCDFHGLKMVDVNAHYTYTTAIEQDIWLYLLDAAIATVASDESYEEYNIQDKLLALLYTLFSNMAFHRAYLVFNLEQNTLLSINTNLLKTLKAKYVSYLANILHLDDTAKVPFYFKGLQKVRSKTTLEGCFQHLAGLILFWKNDQSDDQQKTDAAIEKSVKVMIDVLDTSKVDHAVDLGRFLWKERSSIFKRK